LAETSGQTERMKTAQQRAARLEPRLAWVTIEVAKDALVPGLSIRRNAALVSNELAGTPVPVDPGEVTVDASAPGRLPFSTKVKVTAKARVTVTIPALQAAPEAAPAVVPAVVATGSSVAPTPAQSAPQTAVEQPPSSVPAAPAEHASPIPWVVGGAGVVALGVGSIFGLKAISNADEAREICPKGVCSEEQGEQAASDAHTQAKISNICFALGAAAVATGVVLYFALPTKHGTQVGMLPMVDQNSLGLALRGRLSL
jgi:hypothetical protein